MDAISMLKQDHREVNSLFRQFERARDDKSKKRTLVDQMIVELSKHAAIEEAVFYPTVKGVTQALTETVLESLEEHHVVKWLCSELDGMDPNDDRFDAKTTVLIESVRHHVEEEENELFPEVREALDRRTLTELGDLLDKAKQMAPTRPHPRSPDEPPFNVMATLVAGLVDRAREAGERALKSSGRRVSSSVRRATSTSQRKMTKPAGRTRKTASRPATKKASGPKASKASGPRKAASRASRAGTAARSTATRATRATRKATRTTTRGRSASR